MNFQDKNGESYDLLGVFSIPSEKWNALIIFSARTVSLTYS